MRTLLRSLRVRLRSLLAKPRVEAELDEEIRFHIGMQTEQYLREGMEPEEARRRAMVAFGGVDRAKEESRDERGTRLLEIVVQDARYALRTLLKRPGFTAVAVLTLGLGIGATTAIFSVVNGVVLTALPYEAADRIVQLERANRTDPADAGGSVSPIDVEDWAVAESLESLAVYNGRRVTLTGAGTAEDMTAAEVSPAFFEVFRSSPVLGRTFTAAEASANGPAVVVVGNGFWRERLGGEPDVLGRRIELQGEPHEVVGVAPPGFDYPNGARVWIPVQNDPEGCGRGCVWLSAAGRLASGSTLEGARTELGGIAARLEREYPNDNHEVTVLVNRLQDEIVGSAREALFVLLLAVIVVLLIACVNVANLLLARGAARAEEMAVRAAMGAGRRRLVGQMLTETGLLAALGGGVGLLVAWLGVRVLRTMSPGDIPRLDEVALDGRTLVFAVGLIVLTTIVAGLAPALRGGRISLSRVLRAGGRGGADDPGAARGRSALLVAEVALSVLLLTAAGLLLRSFAELASIDPGFRTTDVAAFSISLPEARYPEPDVAIRFFSRLDEELEALPGVERVAQAIGSPLDGRIVTASFTHTDRPPPEPGQSPGSIVRYVDDDFFEAMAIPVLAGRGIEAADRWGAQPVLVVNRSAADEFWPGQDPIGKQVEMGLSIGYPEDQPRTVVGVVSDVRSLSLAEDAGAELYIPTAQAGSSFVTFLVHTRGESGRVLSSARQVVRRLDPDLPLIGPSTIEATVAADLARPRFMLALVGLFAVLATVLAIVGIYGVVAYVVSRRTREIGIRMAMGATTGRVLGLVVRQGLGPAALGVAGGIAVSFAGMRVLRGMLYGVSPHDPLTLAGVTIVLLATTAAACLLPARRAARIPPATALRNE